MFGFYVNNGAWENAYNARQKRLGDNPCLLLFYSRVTVISLVPFSLSCKRSRSCSPSVLVGRHLRSLIRGLLGCAIIGYPNMASSLAAAEPSGSPGLQEPAGRQWSSFQSGLERMHRVSLQIEKRSWVFLADTKGLDDELADAQASA